LERVRYEKITGYGTTNICKENKQKTAKEVRSRVEITRGACAEEMSNNTGQWERRTGLRNSEEFRML
jgi:hypothetical protein